MSQLLTYFKNYFNPKDNKDRKRRRTEILTEGSLHFPKYRRVSNVFPDRYVQHADDDEIDHFQLVKKNKKNYNALLENFLMSKQQKHLEMLNDEEFSDDEEISSIRVPTTKATTQYLDSQKPSTSGGYNFNSTRQSSSNFNFSKKLIQKPNDTQFTSMSKQQVPVQRRNIPELVPISRSIQPEQSKISNGLSNGSGNERRRGSIINFYQKNRAFNDSPCPKFQASVIDRSHNMKVRNDYNTLLKNLIPRFSSKASNKQSTNPIKLQEEPIETVDLSDEAEYVNSDSPLADFSSHRLTSPLYRQDRTLFKKPFVELSDDEDIEPSFHRNPIISSTLLKAKSDRSNSICSLNKSSSPFTFPDVRPVNTLRDRQKSLHCLQNDVISSIVQKYHENRIKNDSKIREATITASQLSNDTAIHEKLQQRKLDDTVTSLQQCIILDEEDEKIDEFPALTDQMLQIIRYGLQGPRNESLVSKFNMNITRQDLNTLDGMNWLNDEVINFYMELLKQRSEEVDHLPKVHAMNTFFIPKLLSGGHAGVRRWTRKVDIFSFDIIPVPVHVGGVHWCMSVINMREKTIRYYDSMGHPNMPVLDALRSYLEEESKDKRKIVFDTSDWKVECVRDCPQQRNGSDCGVFSCMFAEFLTRGSRISFDQQHMQYFRRKMVFEIVSGKLILGY